MPRQGPANGHKPRQYRGVQIVLLLVELPKKVIYDREFFSLNSRLAILELLPIFQNLLKKSEIIKLFSFFFIAREIPPIL